MTSTWRRPSIAGTVWTAVWTFPLLDPAATITGPVAGLGLGLFWLVYVYATARGFDLPQLSSRARLITFAVVAALGLGLAIAYGPRWLILLLFVSTCGMALYASTPKPVAAGAILAGTLAATAVVGSAHHVERIVVVTTMVGTVLASLLVASARRMSRLVAELRETREALAVAAVAEERLRFSRDLHDLLGHTLSVIVVKAEVVRRLSERDPAAAAAQAADIEEVGRRALVEIREAVTGYREGSGLTAELTRAKGTLSSAGITADVQRTADPLPDDADRLLAWVVREATTNVVRHSGARRCEISLSMVDGAASLAVRDDGRFAAGSGFAPGNGLRGLTERLRSVGGSLETGPRDGGGFALVARVPVGRSL
ncbi:sensor histidine kinase [Dactylosporangium fulvum]|uniref:Histidine kinase n=1 Tax=Dactylosporangium fulvum TaxID=53359 RepID=A0ABY5VYK8_9ACTN|nr:histidine kinase [Dactylosporangium fulvum]UWP80846.1 histidine kinase [Dactylosporangium fulvum]